MINEACVMKKVDSKRASREINDIYAVSIDGAREMGEGGGGMIHGAPSNRRCRNTAPTGMHKSLSPYARALSHLEMKQYTVPPARVTKLELFHGHNPGGAVIINGRGY